MDNNKKPNELTENTPFIKALNEARTAYLRGKQMEDNILKTVENLTAETNDKQVKYSKGNVKMYLAYYIHGVVGFDGLKTLLERWGNEDLFNDKVWEELRCKGNKNT